MPETPYTRAGGRDPVPSALAEAGELHADQREFHMLGGRGQVAFAFCGP